VIRAWPYPLWIAHRGAGKLAPENTLAAFRLGASFGYRGFECDVKLSADDVPFLLHDPTLDRTTSGQGRAAECSWAELSRLDAGAWLAPSWAGEPPASLASIAAFVQANDALLNIEIKPTPGDEAHTGSVVAREAARLWAGVEVPPLLSSFRTDALRAARDAAADLPRALLLDELHSGCIELAESLGCSAVVTQHRLMNAALLERLRHCGLRALCYTVNEAHDAERLLALGIDGLITDAVDRFAPVPAPAP
jgi:glycerophosphoryl diester phosphodiesterase